MQSTIYAPMLLSGMLACLVGCSAEDALYYAVYPFTWVDVKAVDLSPDGKKAASSTGQIWDINGKFVAQLDQAPSFRLIRFSNDATKIIGVGDNGTILYDAQTGRQLWHNSENSGLIHYTSVAFSPDDKYVLVHVTSLRHPNKESRIFQFDAETGRTVKTIERGGRWYEFTVILSPNGEIFATFDTKSSAMNIYDIETENLIRHLPIPKEMTRPLETNPNLSATFSQNGEKIVICGEPNTIIVDLKEQDNAIRSLGGRMTDNSDRVSSASDGRKLVISSGSKVNVIDLTSGRSILVFDNHPWRVSAVALSADGKHVLSSCESSDREYRPGIHYWDIETGKIQRTFRAR